MACDLCGKRGCHLVDLRDVYQTPEVQQVCFECEETINAQLRKVQNVAAKITFDAVKRFILNKFKGEQHE